MKRIIQLIILVGWQIAVAQPIVEEKNLFDLRRLDIKGKTTAQIDQSNRVHLEEFIAYDVDTPRDNSKFRAQFISPETSQEVLTKLVANPVASSSQSNKYDPKGNIGFCFGRAMFVNLELAYRRFDRDSIKKIFAIGPMETGGSVRWEWHVATIVQSINEKAEEEWLAIDSVTGLVTLNDWYEIVYNRFSVDQKLKVYITPAGKFGGSSSFYDHDSLESDFYNEYFIDLLSWFGEQYNQGGYKGLVVEEYANFPGDYPPIDLDPEAMQPYPVLGL